jgi:hypothetical protein
MFFRSALDLQFEYRTRWLADRDVILDGCDAVISIEKEVRGKDRVLFGTYKHSLTEWNGSSSLKMGDSVIALPVEVAVSPNLDSVTIDLANRASPASFSLKVPPPPTASREPLLANATAEFFGVERSGEIEILEQRRQWLPYAMVLSTGPYTALGGGLGLMVSVVVCLAWRWRLRRLEERLLAAGRCGYCHYLLKTGLDRCSECGNRR